MSTGGRVGVVVFPGSNCDKDCVYVGQRLGASVSLIWHKETTLPDLDLLILPGGFSYGDFLRAGAIARFSPIMQAIVRFAASGGYVLGICNGFQILVEVGLLPGALMPNTSLQFICKTLFIRAEAQTPFTSHFNLGTPIPMPIAHAQGNYYTDDATLSRLRKNRQIVFRYCTKEGALESSANPNGSTDFIAGICNKDRNVLGMMPHPERVSEALLGGEEGIKLFSSVLSHTGHVGTHGGR